MNVYHTPDTHTNAPVSLSRIADQGALVRQTILMMELAASFIRRVEHDPVALDELRRSQLNGYRDAARVNLNLAMGLARRLRPGAFGSGVSDQSLKGA